MLHQLDLSFDGREPAAQLLEKAAVAVEHGVATIWLACHLFERDPVTTAAVLLERHERLNIVLVVISPFVVHPVQIAMSAATLNELFPGRVSLCLGVGAPDDLASAGIERPRPAQTLSEALQLCRRLFSGERVTFEGERFQVRGRAMGAGAQPLPLLLAASGPRMLDLAGHEADGVLLSAGASAEFTAWCIEQVHHGRPKPEGYMNCGLVYAAIDDQPARAVDRIRPKLALTLRGAHHAHNLEVAGSDLDQEALRLMIADGRLPEAAELVPEDVALRHAIVGTPENFRGLFQRYRAAGLDRVVMASLGQPAEIAAALKALQNEEGDDQ